MDMFLKLRTEARQYELTGYWLAMANRFDMVEGYNAMIARYEGTSSDPSELVYRLNQTATFLYISARHEGAEPLCRRALGISEKVFGPEHPDIAQSLNNLALLLDSKGDYKGAEPLYRRALAIYEKSLDHEHPWTRTARENLDNLLKTKKKSWWKSWK
jgi:tetratricopeptide (TPR) repeat protein